MKPVGRLVSCNTRAHQGGGAAGGAADHGAKRHRDGEGGDGEEPGAASRPSASGQDLLARFLCIRCNHFGGTRLLLQS